MIRAITVGRVTSVNEEMLVVLVMDLLESLTAMTGYIMVSVILVLVTAVAQIILLRSG